MKESDALLEHVFLTNKIIREFLKHFKEPQWNTVLKFTVIYGIQALKEHYPVHKLNTKMLEEILKNNSCYQAVEENIPAIELKLKEIKNTIKTFEETLGIKDNSSRYK